MYLKEVFMFNKLRLPRRNELRPEVGAALLEWSMESVREHRGLVAEEQYHERLADFAADAAGRALGEVEALKADNWRPIDDPKKFAWQTSAGKRQEERWREEALARHCGQQIETVSQEQAEFVSNNLPNFVLLALQHAAQDNVKINL